MSPYGWGRYVSVAERRAKAQRKIAKMRKAGRSIKPVEIAGRTIAKTFWGKSWCQNLEAYSDYANRLPRGRTYARNGSIVDLQIREGRVDALVAGTRLYTVALTITPVPADRWTAIRDHCAGGVDSLVELLQGKLSRAVMEVVTRPGTGLFPSPKEIRLSCSCPDWAVMCKHVAATLYGVGARLDHEPEMLFSLRGVDPAEMIEEAIDRGFTKRKARGRVLAMDHLSSVFGVDIDFGEDALIPPKRKKAATRRTAAKKETGAIGERGRQVLALITQEPGLRTPELAQRLGVSRSTVRNAIATLRAHRLVTFEGAPRNGGYQSVDKN
jgi:uncharacterized Zn finger protein